MIDSLLFTKISHTNRAGFRHLTSLNLELTQNFNIIFLVGCFLAQITINKDRDETKESDDPIENIERLEQLDVYQRDERKLVDLQNSYLVFPISCI